MKEKNIKYITKHHKLQYLEFLRLVPNGLTATEIQRVFDGITVAGVKTMLRNLKKKYLLDCTKNSDDENVYILNNKGIEKIEYMRKHNLGKNSELNQQPSLF